MYGEATIIPTPEDAPFPVQTSLYGASKLAGEGLIPAYAEGYGMQGYIFRFVSILGERYTHGHVFDFVRMLSTDPTRLHILGDGLQRKSYLYVSDCVSAILTAMQAATDKVNIFNLGTEEFCEVKDSIGWISQRLGVSPRLTYSGGDRGWIGDNPFIFLDTKRIRSLGWTAEAQHPARCRADGRLAADQSTGFLPNEARHDIGHEGCGPWHVASRNGDGRLRRHRRDSRRRHR